MKVINRLVLLLTLMGGHLFGCTVLNWQGAPTTVVNSGNITAWPTLCVGENGTAVALWQETIGALTIQASVYNPTTMSWGMQTQLSTPGSIGGDQPEVCCLPNGDAIAVWEQSLAGPNFKIWGSYYSAATQTWSVATQISGAGAAVHTNSTLSCNSSGNAIVAWQIQSGGAGIEYATFDGTTWSAPGSVAIGNYARPDICMDEAGNARSYLVPDGGTQITIRAVNVMGVIGPAQTVTVNE